MTKFTIAMVSLVGMAGLAFAGDPKADPKGAGGAKMEMPKPPQEIADMAKAMGGTWKCDGMFHGMGGADMKYTSSMKAKTDLAGWYIHETSDIKPADKKAMPNGFQIEAYMTYSSNDHKWHRMEVMSDGGMTMGTSDGPKDNKMEMTADTWGPMGQGMMKVNIDMSDMKKGVSIKGQMSMDKGKTWNPMFEETCKK